jgi:hypothetical protein
MGNDLTKGTTYVDGGTINAANLNAHVDDAVFKSTAISARTLKTPMAITDEFLINDSGTLKKITGDELYNMATQTGAVIQSTYGIYTTSGVIATLIPVDDTIPQISEGTQILSLSFTPRFVNSKMVLRFVGLVSTDAANRISVAVFRDAGVNAVVATGTYIPVANAVVPVSFIAVDLPVTVATITYTVRAGMSVAGTMRFNGPSSGRRYGGVAATTFEVQEVRVP